MRHGDKIKNLSRTASHRRALLANLAINLIEHKRITTTLTKAKSLRVYVEPLITRCKQDTTHNRRMVFSYLQNKESIKELFGVISDKIGDRPGGYTRIIKLAPRFGDAAEMALIELVDFNELYKKDAQEADKKRTRRSRRGGGGGNAASVTADAAVIGAASTVDTTQDVDTAATDEATFINDANLSSEAESTNVDPVDAATEDTSANPAATEAAPAPEAEQAPSAAPETPESSATDSTSTEA
jgi:large subunit ribosomal protein L17